MTWKRISGFKKPKGQKKKKDIMTKKKTPQKIKFQGEMWTLWTEIPPWSDYKPADAVREAGKDHWRVEVKRISRYGKVSVQILVRGEKKKISKDFPGLKRERRGREMVLVKDGKTKTAKVYVPHDDYTAKIEAYGIIEVSDRQDVDGYTIAVTSDISVDNMQAFTVSADYVIDLKSPNPIIYDKEFIKDLEELGDLVALETIETERSKLLDKGQNADPRRNRTKKVKELREKWSVKIRKEKMENVR